MSYKRPRLAAWLFRHPVPILLSGLFLVPMVWIVSTSLRKIGLPPPVTLEWWPDPVSWSNYTQIFETVPLGRYLLNSLIVAGVAIPVTLVVASMAGFAISLLGGRVRRALLTLTIALIMIPGSAMWLARLFLFRDLGLLDTLWPLMAPAIMGTNPFYILIFYWTFRRIPSELFEAARLEGAGALRLWRSIALPLARAPVSAVCVLTFFTYWSDFLNPLLYLKSETNYTLAAGLQFFRELGRDGWPLVMAVVVVTTVPVLALFLLVQRYFWPRGSLLRQ